MGGATSAYENVMTRTRSARQSTRGESTDYAFTTLPLVPLLVLPVALVALVALPAPVPTPMLTLG